MTDDLDQLGPGPALDAIVAREVFGLDVLGEWPTIPDPAAWMPAKVVGDRAVMRPVHLWRCGCADSGDDWATRHFAGVDLVYGHRIDCLDVVRPYSDEPVACASVVKACRDAGWFDHSIATGNAYGRWFSRLDGCVVATGTGSHEYAVACVAAIRVARLVGGPLVKPVPVVVGGEADP